MPRTRAKDEVEFAFGLKEAVLLLLLVGVVVGGTFLWGFEAGHKRALRGEPSLLGFLEKTASPHSEPVTIPDVLLEDPPEVPSQAGPSESEPADATQSPPATASSEVAEAAGAVAESSPPPREKPSPAGTPEVAATAEREPPPPPGTPSGQVPAPSQPAADASSETFHYQVAALGMPKNAKDLVDWLRGEGFPARIQPANADGLYRVYVGPYRSAAEAELARERLQKDGFKPLLRKF